MKSVLISLALVSTCAAQAAEFTRVLPEKSAVTFVYQQMGVSVDGQFKKLAGHIRFDPAKPAAAQASFEIDLTSVDTGTADGNQEVLGKSWFNTRMFPTARFESTHVKPLGGNKYEVAGQLRIKGQTQAVVMATTFTAQGPVGVFDGSFALQRGDFSIGEGPWAQFDIVANKVLVKFHLTTTQ